MLLTATFRSDIRPPVSPKSSSRDPRIIFPLRLRVLDRSLNRRFEALPGPRSVSGRAYEELTGGHFVKMGDDLRS